MPIVILHYDYAFDVLCYVYTNSCMCAMIVLGVIMSLAYVVKRKAGYSGEELEGMLRVLTPEQRHSYLHKLQVAHSYRRWADEADQEARDILAGNQWWCSPTPQDVARQVPSLAHDHHWPTTNNSVYCERHVDAVPMQVTKSPHERTVVMARNRRRNKRQRKASMKATQFSE